MRSSARGFALPVLLLAVAGLGLAQAAAPVRPPAVPLVTHDPYFSIWSMADRLTQDWPKHWTGRAQAMMGMVRVDGRPYRFMGPEWRGIPALAQTDCRVYPRSSRRSSSATSTSCPGPSPT